MTEFRKVVQCPNCRFANRLGEKRCLICKAELPAAPAAGPSATPAPLPRGGPSPATNTAAAARAGAGAKPSAPPGVMRRLVDPTKQAKPVAPQKEVTAQMRRPDMPTSVRPAADPSLLEPEVPPKPLTKRVARPGAATDAVAWIWCDPLPPIPLFPTKQVIVGRQDTCDLVLPHKEVSRAHAVFKVAGKQISLEDQGSSNGCYVNGKRSANAVVKVGDVIQIGPYEIELKATGDEGADLASDTKSFDLTSINSAGPGASMTGKLSDVPLVEILQTIEFNAKTATLAISDGKLKGRVVFAGGRPVTASFGGERDLDAVRAMLALKDGRFVLSNEVEPCEATMNLTVTALLLDAARGMDEAGAPADPVAAEPPEAAAYESNSYPLDPGMLKTAQHEEPAAGDAPTAQVASDESGAASDESGAAADESGEAPPPAEEPPPVE